jgi:chemotaxis protein CheD
MWHPELRIGGMCHYLLPTRRKKGDANNDLDGRYGDEAIQLFTKEAQRRRTHPKQYEIKIFGGADMFPRNAKGNVTAIGTLNVSGALSRLRECGCVVKAQHVGGIGHRIIVMEVWSGEVWVKHHPNYVEGGANKELPQ